ncbi:MAG: DUF7009 family protein [bacterium]|jgi:hypothetical protein
MKLRIQDNSIRFRISLKELEEFNQKGQIMAETVQYHPETLEKSCIFQYGIRKSSADPSECVIQPGSIILQLDDQDCKTLNNPSQEGVYLQKEVQLMDGTLHRFIAFVEKDRPSTKCDKPEEWIYQKEPGQRPVTLPIRKAPGD